MSSHDLSLNSINKTAPVKTDTKTAAVEKTESEGFVEELKEVMGLKEKDDAKKTTVEEKGDVEKAEAAEKSKESESVETKEETTEEKVSQGSELLSRLDQANSTLVDEKDQTKKEKAIQDSELLPRLEQSNSTLVNKKESDDKESSDDSESLTDAEVMLTQASIAAKGEKNSSKTVAEKTDPLKEIQWGSSAKSSTQVEGETQSKGEASGNKESTKELLTSTALIGKAEAEAGKLAEAKKTKIDISALGMTHVANGEAVSLTEAKTTDSFAQQLATASGATATQQATAAQKMDPAMAPLNIRQEQVSDEVAERINMMMAKNLKHVDIRLDPPEMGRMHIRLNMGADSAGVQFTVSNQQARDAIEQSLPRLREMFAQQGIQLADTSVQQQNSGESSQYAYQKEESSRQGSGFNEEFSEEKEINVQVSKPNDGISFYA